MKPLKVLTWNINGIRAVKGKSMKCLLDSLNADIISFQETKVTRDMLDEPTAIVEGYESYFGFSRKRTGYSGTANFCSSRAAPVKAEEGLSGRLSNQNESLVGNYGDCDSYTEDVVEALDAEGRCVITQHKIRLQDRSIKEVAIINVYVPRSGDREDRKEYKLKFLSLLQSRAEELLRQDIHVIVLGDLNLTHKKLDNCDPNSDDDFQRKSSRIWMNQFLQPSERDSGLPNSDSYLSELSLPKLEGGHFSDVYRRLFPDQESAFTNWCTSTDARKSNYGRRLDYILIDTKLAQYVSSCEIMTEIEGSDHCPVVVTLDCEPVPSNSSPLLCSRLMPEFRGQQQKLSLFFSKTAKSKESQSLTQVQVEIDVSPISSQEDNWKIETIHSSPLQKSSSLPSDSLRDTVMLKKSASDAKMKTTSQQNTGGKRGANPKDKVGAKKQKIKQEESGSKQVSLTSFFGKVSTMKNSASEKVSPLEKEISSSLDVEKERKNFTSFSKTALNIKKDSTSTTLNNDDGKCLGNVLTTNSPKVLVTDSEGFSLSKRSDPSSDSKASVVISTEDMDHSTASNGDAITVSSLTSSKSKATTITNSNSSQAWKSLLKGLPPAPLCPGHKEPCSLKTVNKKGPNKNKQFYVCPRPDGPPGNKEFRCNFFLWLNDWKKKSR